MRFLYFLTSASCGSGARRYGRALSSNTVVADFESPKVSLGWGKRLKLPPLSVGPVSTVRLDTSYLGPKLRVSRGASSGTLFLFTPVPALEAEKAETWRSVVAKSDAGEGASAKPLAAKLLLVGCALALTGLRASDAVLPLPPVFKPWLAAAALGCAVTGYKLAKSSGGVVVSPETKLPGPAKNAPA